jgi:surface protein
MSINALKISVSYEKVGIANSYQWDLYVDGIFYQTKNTVLNNIIFNIPDHIVDSEIRIKLTIFYKGGSYQLINDFVYTKPISYSPMITEWSLTTNNSITLPLPSTGTYDFIVDWGDGNSNTVSAYNVGNQHTYATSGIKTVSVSGLMTHWSFNNAGDKLKITSVLSGGYTGLTNLSGGFRGCSNLTFIENNPIWTRNVNTMYLMFHIATAFNSDISNWNVSNVTDMYYMFGGATSFNQNISGWNTSNVITMTGMLSGTSFNSDISSWNVSNVTDMVSMFNNATSFNQDISSWNVSNVTDMSSMFLSATNFNQPLNSWNVSNVTNMNQMFRLSGFNQPLNSWDTGNVSNMHQLFDNSPFNQDISAWNVSNVIDMGYMFLSATNFNQPLNSWNVSNVTNMSGMLDSATSFNQPLNSWDISKVTNMNYTLSNATSFNQDISSWSVSSVTSMASILSNTSFSTTNYDLLLNSWASQNVNSNVAFGCSPTKYSAGGSASKDSLVNTKGWIISDGGLAP